MIVKIVLGLVVYIAFVLFIARMFSHKWHPDAVKPTWHEAGCTLDGNHQGDCCVVPT